MTSYIWQVAGNGDWSAAGNWSPSGGPPKSKDSATIAATGSAYAVTVSSADVASSLALSSADATLNDDGAPASLTISGTLAISNGTLNVANGIGGSLTVGALSLSGGSLNINTNGQLNLGSGTLSQTGGTLTLAGGTIAGGTINSTAGTLALNSGTLSGVTFDGPLNLTSTTVQQTVDLANGTKIVGSFGSGPGAMNVIGYSSVLNFDNTQTVGNVTINLGASRSSDYLNDNDTAATGNKVLTLASSVIVNATGFSHLSDGGNSGDGIVNQGVINQTGDGTMYVAGNAFTNSGTINANGAGALDISAATFSNSGTIDIANGDNVTIEPTTFTTTASSLITIEANSSLTIDPANAWSNLGSIRLASGASLTLHGSMSAASLGSITNSGGTVDIAGTYNNSRQTLDGSASFGQLVLLNGGAITGGTATSAGVGFATNGGTLSGVTYDGPLNLMSTSLSQIVDLANSAAVVGSSGSGPGTINVTGFDSQLKFDNTQTVSNETINLGNSSFLDHLYENDTAGAGGQVLTLASSVTLNVTGRAQIQTTSFSGDAIVNQGVINQMGSSFLTINGSTFTNSGTINAKGTNTLTISPTTFTNSGAIDVADGDTAVIVPAAFTNLASNTLTAGTYEVEAGSTLQVNGFAAITTLDADVILSGIGSQFLDKYSGASSPVAIDSLLTTIGASGELQLLAGRSWTTANAAITNNGVIQLGGGALTSGGGSASLTNAGGSTLIGFGTVTATTFTNSGVIEASDGTLTLTDAVAGTGGLDIDSGADLVVGGAIASGATATFNGPNATLTLNQVSSFGATVGAIVADDTFDLVGITANGAAVNPSNHLVLTENGTPVATLQLNGAYSGLIFQPVAVSGGTDIVATQNALPNPATVAQYLANVSGYDQIPGGFAISDTAANITTGLDQLNDPNINAITISDNGAIGVDVAQLTSDATAIGKFADANMSPYQLAIADTAANVTKALSTLKADAGHIGSIAVSGGPITVSAATYLSNQAVLDKIVGGFAISDTLPNIVGRLNAFDADANIDSISATSGSATLAGETAIASPAFSVTGVGTALTVKEDLVYSGALTVGAGAKVLVASGDTLTLIEAVTGTGGLQVNGGAELVVGGAIASGATATFNGANATLTLNHPSAFGATVGGIGVSDVIDLVGITANVATVNASNKLVVTENGTTVDTLQLSGSISGFSFQTVPVSGGTNIVARTTATVAQYLANPLHYDKIQDGFVIADAAASITAAINQLDDPKIDLITILDDGRIGVSAAQLTSDATTIGKLMNANATPYQLAVSDSAANVKAALSILEADVSHIASIAAAGGPVGLDASTFSADRAALDKIVGGYAISDTLPNIVSSLSAFDADANIDSIAATSGSATLTGGVAIAVPAFSLTGATALTVQENLTYAGKFSASGATLTLAGGNLTLTGANSFAGAAIGGAADTLTDSAAATVSRLTIGGQTTFDNTKTLTESGGAVTVGDVSGYAAELVNASTGTWDIVDNSGIALGSSPLSSISNSGLFEKTGGTGTSAIAPSFANAHNVLVSSGALDFQRAVSGTGTDTISGASSVLEFDATVASSTKVGSQDVVFNGGTLDLTSPEAFWGEISNFAPGDAIDLLGSWAFSAISDVSGVTTLTLASGKATHAFTFVGDYAKSDFSIASGATTIIGHT